MALGRDEGLIIHLYSTVACWGPVDPSRHHRSPFTVIVVI
jgi:hypothetical protein